MHHRYIVGPAFAMSVATLFALLFGDRTDSVAQAAAVQVVRICARGTAACISLVGRSWSMAQPQDGTVTIPQGCGVLSRDGAVTLRAFGSSLGGGRAGDPTMNMTAYPSYADPKPGDRIDINADNQQCCLSEAGDKVANCQNQNGEKVVRVTLGPRH